MAEEGIHANIKAIQDMEAACARFARTVVGQLPEIDREVRRVMEALEERRNDLRREIESLREAIRNADEDEDVSWERERVEEAKGELSSVNRRKHRMEEAANVYTIHARTMKILGAEQSVKMANFLTCASENLRIYLANDSGRSGSAETGFRSFEKPWSDHSTKLEEQQPSDDDWITQKLWADRYLNPEKLLISYAERAALVEYQGDGFRAMNQALRGELPLSADVSERIELIRAVIQRSRVPAGIRVFHAVPYEHSEEYRTGDLWEHPDFLSASFSRKSAEKHLQDYHGGGSIVQIELDTEENAVYMDDLDEFHGDEVEILFPPGKALRIKRKYYGDSHYYITAKFEK
ncbi:MAG: hypothetical protein HYV96_21200 [Opitutae bacterium]|nr:hypothetical protein [Opitutae bacterium]